jgi:hypothetical protein
MAKENFNFPIPNEILEPYIKEAVSTTIIAALGDGTELVKKAVHAALRTKVGPNGTISSSSYDNKYDLVETVASNKINEIARETIYEMAEQMRPKIVEAVKKELVDNHARMAEALVNGLIESVTSRWSCSVKFFEH